MAILTGSGADPDQFCTAKRSEHARRRPRTRAESSPSLLTRTCTMDCKAPRARPLRSYSIQKSVRAQKNGTVDHSHRRQRCAVDAIDRETREGRPGRDDGRDAILAEEVEPSLREHRRGRVAAGAKALLIAHRSCPRIDLREDAVVADDVEIVRDEHWRRRVRCAACQRP